jgi:hypothetical protein
MIFQIIIILNSIFYFFDSVFLGFIESIKVYGYEIDFCSLTIIYIMTSAIFTAEFVIYEKIIKRELKVYGRLRD